MPLPIKGRRRILDRESFVEFMLRRGLSREELHRQFPEIATNTIVTSLLHYRDEFSDELRRLKSRRYATAMKGNRRGAKAAPALLIDKTSLEQDLQDRLRLPEIARKYSTTEWFVRASIEFHGLAQTDALPYKMRAPDREYLERLEQFAPGLTAAAERFYDDPHTFYLRLYDAFVAASELLWFIREQASGYGQYVHAGKVPRDHVSWRANRHELRLSQALLVERIPHIREIAVGRYWFDFLIQGPPMLLVEVDGSFHVRDDATRLRDAQKTALAADEGMPLLRFTTDQIDKELPWVLDSIRNALSGASPPSVP